VVSMTDREDGLVLSPCHWLVTSLSSLTMTGHPALDTYINLDPFVLGLLIPDDGGSTHL
jgi:hypothetical protein